MEMYAGLFKQNCDRSWITIATLVAGVDTWKSNLTCQSLSLLILTSNYGMFVELKIHI